MAWMEMRILIAKMVFHFDYELVDDNLDWERDSQCFVLWQKPDLLTKVIPRVLSDIASNTSVDSKDEKDI